MLREATIPIAVLVSTLSLGDIAGAQQANVPILSMRAGGGGVSSPTAATAEGRLLIGRGKDYQPVSGTQDQQVLFDELMKNMKARRDFSWKVVEQLLQPIKVTLPGGAQVDVPLWQTWYDGRTGAGDPTDEIQRLFTSYFQKLKANPTADKATLADQALAEEAQKNLTDSVTVAKLTTPLRQNATVSTDIGGQGRTMFSPSFVKHMMVSAKEVENCGFAGIKPTTPAPSPTNFSHCIQEFPRNAVMIKTSWKELSTGIAVHDNSAAAQAAVIGEGTWPGANHPTPTKRPPTVVPTKNQIYTNETREGRQFGLVGIHLVTKDVREWVWVSLWWSPEATRDFGADRPSSIAQFNGGVWSNYKMCVNSSFDEGDPQPWSHYTGNQATLGDSIKSTYDTIQSHVTNGIAGPIILGIPDNVLPATARGPWAAPHNKNTSWCSNPFVEVQRGNGRTSCIGCHQLTLTESLNNSTLPATFAEAMFGFDPQFARSRNFNNFSTDFSWAFQGQYQPLIKEVRQQVGFTWP